MGTLLSFLNGLIFNDLPSTAALELLKTGWEKATEKSWEELYLDAFDEAFNVLQPHLSKYIEGGELHLDQDAVRKALHEDLHISVSTKSPSELTNQQFAEILAKSLAARQALIIGGHTLNQIDYEHLVYNLVEHAHSIFRQSILKHEAAFRQAILAEATNNQETVQALQIYLFKKFDLSFEMLSDIRQQIDLHSKQLDRIENSIKSVHQAGTSTPKTKVRISVHLDYEISGFSDDVQAEFIKSLSHIIGTATESIRIIDISQGSVIVTLEMPADVAKVLLSLYGSNTPQFQSLRIINIEFYNVTREVDGLPMQKTAPMKSPILPPLLDALNQGGLALFIGADLPQEYTGLPSRLDLAQLLARRYGLDESLSLASVSMHINQAGNRFEFTSFLKDALDTTGKSPRSFHKQVATLIGTGKIDTVITTAYDKLLEIAFDKADIAHDRIVRGSDVAFINPNRLTLIKLYGDIQQLDTLVVTDRDHSYLLRDRDREPLVDEVRQILRRKTVLFLGYNLSDPDFLFLFDQVAQSHFARKAYAVWPKQSDMDKRMWQERGIEILDAEPLDFLEKLLDALTEPSKELTVMNSPVSEQVSTKSPADIASIQPQLEGKSHNPHNSQQKQVAKNEELMTAQLRKTGINQLPILVKGKIDFGIITIREDEFEAVLERFAPEPYYFGDRRYVIGRVDLDRDDYYQVAIARCTDQGEGPAQDLARDMIEQLDPEWLLVVGIAGGVPDDDFTLGDVVVAKRLLDFSVKAISEGKPPEYDVRGWAHPLVEQVCAALPAMRKKLEKKWNSPKSIGALRPGVQLDQEDKFYGDDAWKQKVKISLDRHFLTPRSPRFTTAVIGATEELVKSPTLVQLWLQDARSLRAVEMELAGVYQAARRVEHQYPVLAIRGISDIVGFKRDSGWTTYACHSAASFAYTLVKSGFIKPSIVSRLGNSAA